MSWTCVGFEQVSSNFTGDRQDVPEMIAVGAMGRHGS